MSPRKTRKTPTEIPQQPSQEPENEIFYVGEWAGMKRWQCKLCAWDTLEGEDELMRHYLARHVAALEESEAPQPEPLVQIYNKWGRPVSRTHNNS